MSVLQIVMGLAVGGFLAVLAYGLITGRIDWRQQGCCPADPDHDARMRTTTGTTDKA